METLALIAIGGGTGLSTYSTIQQGKESAEEGKVMQQKYLAEAKSKEEAGLYELAEMRRESERRTASQIADISANGGALTGSNLALVANSAYEAAMDRMVTAKNYSTEITKLTQAGQIARYQGRQARRRARMKAVAGIAETIGTMYLMYKLFPGGTGSPGTTATKTGGGTVYAPPRHLQVYK